MISVFWSSTEDDKTPTLNQLMGLRDCGLGKRKVVFQDKNSDHEKVREVLETTYPKLKTQNGAFELLRAQRGGVSQLLQVIPLSGKGYSIDHLKENVNSNTIIYIQSMQGDLSMSKVDIPAYTNITSECQHCHQKISLSGLRAHLQICQRINADDQDQEHHDEDISDQESQLSMTTQECKADQIFPSMSKCEIDKDWEQELSTLFPDADRDEIGDAIFGSLSIEEPANQLIDTTQKDYKVIHKENSFKSATPASPRDLTSSFY